MTTTTVETSPEIIAQRFAAQLPTALALRMSTAKERIAKLRRLREALLARRTDLHDAFARDFRKPAAEVDLTELLTVVDEIHAAIRGLPRWMKPRWTMPTLLAFGTSARVAYQGKGRCLVIGPWNYPVATLIGPLVSAVAAGNAVILKPSEFTPAVNAVLAEVVGDAFDPEEVVMIPGGVATTQALLELPFDHVFFTGSPAVGKIVMTAAARHLASVTLELGGKSPVIVDETADLDRAAEVIVWGKLINGGQTCVAPDTLYVQRRVRDQFLTLCQAVIARRYGRSDSDIAASPDLARIVNEGNAKRIAALIDEARAAGAQVVAGGGHDAKSRYVAPTIIANVPRNARIASEEIFGPVLPVVEFDRIDEVIGEINSRPKPLALYLWSERPRTVDRVLRETSSGSAVVNHCVMQFAHSGLPFGGVGNSGMGNGHGVFGFKAFSHERAVLNGSRLLVVRAFFPPYTALTRKLIGMLLGYLRRA